MVLCSECLKKPAVGRRGHYTKLVYKGLAFKKVEVPPQCCPACAKALFIKAYEEHCQDLITIGRNGRLKIRWRLFARAEAQRDVTVPSTLYPYAAMRNTLLALGKLTHERVGNWEVTEEYRYSFYFPSKADAVDFAKALHKSYTLFVTRVEQIISICEGKVICVQRRCVRRPTQTLSGEEESSPFREGLVFE